MQRVGGSWRLPPSFPPFPGRRPESPFQNLLPGRAAVPGAPSRDARTVGRTDGAAAALTRFLRRRRFCEVGARLLQRLLALVLLRVDVLGLRLLAPRHGARIGAPGRALVPCPLSATNSWSWEILPPFGRNAHVPVIIIINNALRFIMSSDS